MLELKQTQKLLPVLTQQLQQAIKLLQMSQLELAEAIEQELEENPVLEAKEQEPAEAQPKEEDNTEELFERYTSSEDFINREDKEYPDYENIVKKTYNLRDYLRWQTGFSSFDSNERIASEWIIENIDDNGYLVDSLAEISKASGYSQELLENVLKKIQKFDPPGVGARHLRESVFLQYEAQGVRDAVFEDVMNLYFDLYPKASISELVKKTGYSQEEIHSIISRIKEFDPKPGRNFSDEFTSYIAPDVYVIKGEDGFEVYLSDENIPELKLNGYYVDLYRTGDVDNETKKYIKSKTKEAEWFIKSLKQRQKTLYNVSNSIVRFQEHFFEKGVRYLKPMILKDVAQDIGVHESTVSRITTNKYMSTQFGVFELKFFFPTGIYQDEGDQLSTNVIKDLILEYTGKEDKKSPLTDDELVLLLKTKHDIKIARRTVAKYREILNIGSSRQRKVQE